MTSDDLKLVSLFLPVVLILGGAVGGFSFYALLVRRLQRDHTAIWQSLGSPSYFPGDPRSHGNDYWYGALFDGIWRRDYLSVCDPDVVRLARISRIFLIGIFAGLACIALLVVWGLIIMLGG